MNSAEFPRSLRARWLVLLAPLVLAAADSAPLADLSLEELMNIPVGSVVGASKYEQRVTRAPASITIVNADDIEKFAYRNLGEILQSVAGLHVTNDRNYSFLGFRGFAQPGDYNTGVLLLIDGHRINDPLYNLMYVANESVVTPAVIDRVEIIRGPSSSIYGNSAFFGVVNVVTKKGGAVDGLALSGEAGNFGSWVTRGVFGRKFAAGLELLLAADYFETRGDDRIFLPDYRDLPATDGVARDVDRETARHFHGNLSWRDFTLSAAFSDRRKEVPVGPMGSVFSSHLTRTIDQRGYVDLKYEHAFDDLTILARASYDWYPYRATWPYPNETPPPAITLNRDDSESRWARAEVQATKRIGDRHTLVMGAEYQDNIQLRQTNSDDSPPATFLDLDHGSRNYAAYVQGEFTLARPLLLNAGLRYDHHESFGGSTNPRLGLLYSPRAETTLKALYGEAFRAPTDYELNFESVNNKRNPKLQPPTIRTYEVVWEQYLPPNFRFSASAYRYEITGLISSVLDPADDRLFFANTDNVHAHGVELQLEGKAGAVTGRASYAWQRAEEGSDGLDLTNSPHHLAKLNFTVPLRSDHWFASLEVQHQSTALTPARETTGGFTLANATVLAREFRPGCTLSVSVFNLFDTRYFTPSSGSTLAEAIPQLGRSLRVRFTAKF
jgi:outer membrane receptor for ferrienterochelin and colicins